MKFLEQHHKGKPEAPALIGKQNSREVDDGYTKRACSTVESCGCSVDMVPAKGYHAEILDNAGERIDLSWIEKRIASSNAKTLDGQSLDGEIFDAASRAIRELETQRAEHVAMIEDLESRELDEIPQWEDLCEGALAKLERPSSADGGTTFSTKGDVSVKHCAAGEEQERKIVALRRKSIAIAVLIVAIGIAIALFDFAQFYSPLVRANSTAVPWTVWATAFAGAAASSFGAILAARNLYEAMHSRNDRGSHLAWAIIAAGATLSVVVFSWSMRASSYSDSSADAAQWVNIVVVALTVIAFVAEWAAKKRRAKLAREADACACKRDWHDYSAGYGRYSTLSASDKSRRGLDDRDYAAAQQAIVDEAVSLALAARRMIAEGASNGDRSSYALMVGQPLLVGLKAVGSGEGLAAIRKAVGEELGVIDADKAASEWGAQISSEDIDRYVGETLSNYGERFTEAVGSASKAKEVA